jgi:hypothetical protein
VNRLRAEWIDCVTRSDSIARFLSGYGDVALSSASPLDEEAVSNFLRQLREAGLGYTALLKALLIVGDVQAFVEQRLHKLLRSLNHETMRIEAVVGPALRGHPSWGKTYRGWASRRLESNQFITRLPERSADLPENRLLKHFLERVIRDVASLEPFAPKGALHDCMALIRDRSVAGLRSTEMSSIASSKFVTSHMRSRARRARNSAYRAASELLTKLDDVDVPSRKGHWMAAYTLLRCGWFEPVADDDLFELYVLSLLFSCIETQSSFGRAKAVSLRVAGRAWLARFERKDGAILEVYFNQSPVTLFGCRSEYSALVSKYDGVTGSAHRPDIILRLSAPNQAPCTVLVECKNTDQFTYLSESIYKVLGYIRDFDSLWTAGMHQPPRAILVVPSGVSVKRGSKVGSDELRVVSASNLDDFRASISNVLADADA